MNFNGHEFVNVAVCDGSFHGIGYCIKCGYDANLDLPSFPNEDDIKKLLANMKKCNDKN